MYPQETGKKIDLKNFSFYMPPSMKEVQAKGIDSFVWEASSHSTRLIIDFGEHSNDLTSYLEWPNFQEQIVRIDSRPARLCMFKHANEFMDSADGDRLYIAAVHSSEVGLGNNRLTFWLASNNEAEQKAAETIFYSIKFH
jgi:hypothetical protein